MKRKPPKSSDNWTCTTCGIEKVFTGAEIKEHLSTVHKLTNFKGSRKMVLHVDSADHYISSYEVKVGGVDLIQTAVVARESVAERIARNR